MERCAATSKRTGRQCRRAPIRGGRVCATHGGSAPAVREAARRRLLTTAALADASAVLAHEGLSDVADPLMELGRLTGEARALTLALARRVNALDSVTVASVHGVEQLRTEMALYERSLDRTGRFLEALAKLGYEERRVRVHEDVGRQVADTIHAILADLQLSADQERRAPEIVATHMLRLVNPA